MSRVQTRVEPPRLSQSAGVRRRLRVLMGVPAPGATSGGPALHLPMLVEDLRQRDDVELVTMPYGRWQEDEPLPLKIWHQVQDVARYPARVRAARPDLVHLNTSLDRRALVRDLTFALLTRRLGPRIFLKWHGWETDLLHRGAPWWRALGKLLLRSVDAVGTLSTLEAEEFRRLPQAPRCFVVKNSIEPARYSQRVDLHAKLGLPGGTPLVLFISRLIFGKGLEDLVGGFPEVVARRGAHLLVVGDGQRRRAAEEQVRMLRLQESVHFFGALREAEALPFYNGADVLVFPSTLREGFPMVLFQAVAAGLGVVTTRLRSAVEYLSEPDHCLFVEPNAPAAIACALDRLLGDRELLERMRANNRTLARRFERKAVAAEFERVYRKIVEGELVQAGPRLGLGEAG